MELSSSDDSSETDEEESSRLKEAVLGNFSLQIVSRTAKVKKAYAEICIPLHQGVWIRLKPLWHADRKADSIPETFGPSAQDNITHKTCQCAKQHFRESEEDTQKRRSTCNIKSCHTSRSGLYWYHSEWLVHNDEFYSFRVNKFSSSDIRCSKVVNSKSKVSLHLLFHKFPFPDQLVTCPVICILIIFTNYLFLPT